VKRTPLKRTPFKRKPDRRRQEPDADLIYAAVGRRSRGVCELCGTAPATNFHHRQMRSQGGDTTYENIVHLCGFGNTSGCHGRAHNDPDRYINGWLVRSGLDPATVDFVR
jgi:hypothetical protein